MPEYPPEMFYSVPPKVFYRNQECEIKAHHDDGTYKIVIIATGKVVDNVTTTELYLG